MSIAAVLGGATGGLDELRSIGPVDAVLAVNDAAADFSGAIVAFVTLHPEHLPRWLGARRAAGYPDPRAVIAHEAAPLVTRVVDYRFPGMESSGSSGLFAVKVALEQFDRVVLCGIPMDAHRGHYFDRAIWNDFVSFREAWRIALPHLKNVRSCSGWTAQLLGTP